MKPSFFVIMGVSGSGKTCVGKSLASALGCDFHDGDDFHPPENIAKMSDGIPLNDSDRVPWLASLHGIIASSLKGNRSGVLACSALKERYRQQLREGNGEVRFVYLKGGYDLIWSRMSARAGHYMKPQMLQSQFEALEEPTDALTIDINKPVNEIVQEILGNKDLESLRSNGGGMNDIAIIGLGVMGRSLALHFGRNGYRVAGFDINPDFNPSLLEDRNVSLFANLEPLVTSLSSPRCILLMVPAGKAVDDAIHSLKPFLKENDIIIDGGNSFFADTERRLESLKREGIRYLGMGISGGENGALFGASLMPGGDESAWKEVQPMIESIAAKAEDGTPCVAWMGKGGAGHYVKMVHNGIEYGDMQLIAETYDLLHRGAEIPNAELAGVFSAWNKRVLKSYLIEITARILERVDEETSKPLLDLIADEAEQKETGKWTSQSALNLGVPIPTINAAVEGRLLSNLKPERAVAAKMMGGLNPSPIEREELIQYAEKALYASKITSYAQGFSLLQKASEEYGFHFDLSRIARIWRAGCIIRASLLGDISTAFERNPNLPSLFLDKHFSEEVLSRDCAWREVMKTAVGIGIPMPATGSSLAYFDAYRSGTLPANLIQAQRDCFGAHTYRRIDKEGVFHTEWETK